jgi:hypothetical protein
MRVEIVWMIATLNLSLLPVDPRVLSEEEGQKRRGPKIASRRIFSINEFLSVFS